MKVRTRFIFALLFAAGWSTAQAQFSLGLRGGVHYANWLSDSYPDYERREFISGTTVSAIAEMRVNKVIAFQVEAGWLQKGVHGVSDDLGYSLEEKAVLNYLEIPVLVKIGGGNKVRFDGLAGPSLGVAMNGTVHLKSTILGVSTSNTRDIDFEQNDINRVDLSLQVGGVFSFKPAESLSLFLDARYIQGLANLNGAYRDSSDPAAFNTGLSLSAGALLHF
ncbi:MAG: PorT family protein [Saprospiraceae bacterium]|nr:PorT family protein [Saprospiraceae bacterium]